MWLEKNNEGKMDGAQKSEALLEMVKEKKIQDVDSNKRIKKDVAGHWCQQWQQKSNTFCQFKVKCTLWYFDQKIVSMEKSACKGVFSTFMPKEELM